MEALFWTSVGFVLYVYAGYPLVLALWAKLVSRRSTGRQSGTELPGVTVIIAARDEAQRLPARLDNLLASDYPKERLQIIVASDGSTDDTAEALAPYAGRVTLLLLPASGKAGALNAAVREASHPILVFADARQRFASDAIRRLAAHFDDPAIGAVSGELMLETDGRPSVADGINTYWNYEKWLRRREAIVGSTLGVTGAIYAMRRWLWRPLPVDTILDDVMAPMRIVLGGYRVIFDDQAHAFDLAEQHAASELRRKSRTLAGNFQLLAREPRLLVPILNPVWLQFMSHKVGRLLVPYALVAILVSSGALAVTGSTFHRVVVAGQFGFYALAAYGALLERRARRTPMVTSEVFREAA